VRIWFFGIDWFQIAAIVKWLLVTRLLGEPLVGWGWCLRFCRTGPSNQRQQAIIAEKLSQPFAPV